MKRQSCKGEKSKGCQDRSELMEELSGAVCEGTIGFSLSEGIK